MEMRSEVEGGYVRTRPAAGAAGGREGPAGALAWGGVLPSLAGFQHPGATPRIPVEIGAHGPGRCLQGSRTRGPPSGSPAGRSLQQVADEEEAPTPHQAPKLRRHRLQALVLEAEVHADQDAHEHDDGEKTILGKRGRFDGDELLELAWRHPATARHLAGKLCMEFLGEATPPAAVEELARDLAKHDLDIGRAMGIILRSERFFADTFCCRKTSHLSRSAARCLATACSSLPCCNCSRASTRSR